MVTAAAVHHEEKGRFAIGAEGADKNRPNKHHTTSHSPFHLSLVTCHLSFVTCHLNVNIETTFKHHRITFSF
jgi:hypothetical protein